MSPRRGTAPPRGTPGCLRRCAPAGSAPSSPGRGWPDLCPPRGPGSAALPRALGPEGRERRAPGWTRGASRAGTQAWGQRPWAPVRASSASPYAFRSVCRSVCASGHTEPRGKRGRLTCRRLGSETGAQPPGSSSGASWPLRGPRLSSGTARGSRGRSPRRCRCRCRRRFLQVPSQSAPLARWLPGRLWARAGGRRGRRRCARVGSGPGGRRGCLL